MARFLYAFFLLAAVVLSSCTPQVSASPTPSPGANFTQAAPATLALPTEIPLPSLTISPTIQITPLSTPTPVPSGVFAILFYPPLVFNYDPSAWEDASRYTDANVMLNFLQARPLQTCTLGPEGPNGDWPSQYEVVQLGKISYQFSSLDNGHGDIVSLYLLEGSSDSLPGYSGAPGLPKFNVVASQAEWEQCKALAEKVLATLHVP